MIFRSIQKLINKEILSKRKCVHGTRMPQLQQTGSRQMMDLQRGETVHLTQLMLQTKYKINPTF